ncbi:hypothetical protein I3843_14G029800 [Carya illinoinensis]|uniref:Secreted protein n=1 Tax=Carya illinoinensis TaxID=32201 RepID=A0A8T1NG17_CARIL|nr:hypothetical protein I3760_14G030500 [Carya illinoinensis]KAG6628648.1 hypothetical protein CIPAW_14G027700 [Carya illinoinensis]KAG6677508.1 hypothetical protein I3842_14G030800 [Carya illinoinensis]KAG7946244.1 hypothetical protein I3843_14G029800 [Carya illinoinensis]
MIMSLFSAFFGCFMLSSSRVSDDINVGGSGMKECSSKKSRSKSSGARIVVSHFPVNSYLSRL